MTANGFFRVVLVIAGFIALVAFSAVVSMKVVTWGRNVSVPDLTGRELTAAIGELKSSGLEIRVERQEHHPGVPQGAVISQDPLPGTTVKGGRNVSVVVSLGSEEVTVPDLTGGPLRVAQVELRRAGLTLGEVSRVFARGPRDAVLLLSPEAQSVLQKGERVDLLVSEGPRPDKYVMPGIVGMPPAQAAAALRPMGIKLTPSGKGTAVVSQEPREGYPAESGSEAKATLGTPAPPKPSPPERGVPNGKGV